MAGRNVEEILERPGQIARIIRDIEADITAIRAGFEAGSPSLSFAPGGGGGGGKRDLSCYYARVEDLQEVRAEAVESFAAAQEEAAEVLIGCRTQKARHLLALRYMRGYSVREIADALGMGYDTVYTTIRREIGYLQRKEMET